VKTEDANREVTTPRAAGSNWVAQDGRRWRCRSGQV